MKVAPGTRERSLQQLDPLGTLAARPLTRIAAIGSLAIALLVSIARWGETERPALEVLALVCLASAAVFLIYASSPLRAPFTAQDHWTVAGLAALTAVLAALAQSSPERPPQDDWGMITLGILLAAVTPYRPLRALRVVGAAAAVFLIVLISLDPSRSYGLAPMEVLIVMGILPVVALTYSGIEYAKAAMVARERWQAHAASASLELAALLKPAFARSVQQDRVTILNQEVVPFFSDVLTRGQLSGADLERARAISQAFRAIMVAEVNRGWLAEVVEESAIKGGYEIRAANTVRDDARLADLMSVEQRVSVRALLVALFGESSLATAGFSAVVTGDMKSSDMVITAQTNKPRGMHAHLGPYFAALRVVFPQMRVSTNKTQLILRFSYEQ